MFKIFQQTKSNPTCLLYTLDIVYPFFAYLTGGCSVLSEPLMSYRIHGTQNSYSIAYDKEKNEKQKLILEEKSWVCHLAHALYMKNVLSKLVTISHVKYVEIEKYLTPLLDHQMYLMSCRLILVRKILLDVYKIREIQN